MMSACNHVGLRDKYFVLPDIFLLAILSFWDPVPNSHQFFSFFFLPGDEILYYCEFFLNPYIFSPPPLPPPPPHTTPLTFLPPSTKKKLKTSKTLSFQPPKK